MGKALFALMIALQAAMPPRFDAGRAWEHLRQLVAIGPRPSGSPAIEQTRKYIKDQLGALGLTTVDQTWDDQTPLDKVRMVNLVATIPGARKERVVFAGHYDTKLFRQFRFVGASDGASSAAFLLELARVLKARKNALTVELLFLDGEEARLPEWNGSDNTYGSRHYVELGKRDGSLSLIKALVLIDMIGDRDLEIRRDTNSTPWLTNVIWEAARQKNLDDYFVPDAAAIEDDHLPFLAAGVPSVDIIDLENYQAHGKWHTAQDTLDAVSARSLQVVGDVVLAALPQIETRFSAKVTLTGHRLSRPRPYTVMKARAKSSRKHRLPRASSITTTVAH